MNRVLWLIPLAVLLGDAALATWLRGTERGAMILYLRMDLASAVAIAGVALVAGSVLLLLGSTWARRRERAARVSAQSAAVEERRRFLRRLDHELKNPLTAIRAGLANLPGAQAAERDALDSIQAQILRLSRLTADLRKLAELEARPLEEQSPLDVGGLLQEVYDAGQELAVADGRNLTLTIPQAPWPLPSVFGDRDLLFLAIYNLLDNALKFSRIGDTVELRAFEDSDTVVVEVADTGIGIPEDETSLVWEELFRGEQARAVSGSGLGLSLVRAIVERHGGRIELRSREGRGTVVSMRLPAAT